MDTRLKNYSHLLTTKMIVFIMVVLCFTGVITALVKVEVLTDGDFGIVFEDNYFISRAFMQESGNSVSDLTKLVGEYKNEKHILSGGTISEDETRREEAELFSEFHYKSRSYNPNLSEEENFKKFKEEYVEKLSQARARLIKDDLREYHLLLSRLKEHKDLFYYASDGVNVYANKNNMKKEEFKSYPAYMLFGEYEKIFYPPEIENNEHLYWVTGQFDEMDHKTSVVYVAFTEQFLTPRINEWKEDKIVAKNNLYVFLVSLLGLIVSFSYLALVTGRHSFRDQELHLSYIDRMYNEVKLAICLGLVILWAAALADPRKIYIIIIPITISVAAAVLVLILSLIRHFKNGTLLKHTLIFRGLYNIFRFIGDVYASGSVGVKTVLIVIGYPILVGLTFFMFPVTLGAAAWLALKRIKAFNAIKEGVEKIKAGELYHTIDVDGNGEFARLASSINSINDGLKKAVGNELKSERLKTELITNVSHDIRTPLTSIITYVDLLKKEDNPIKAKEYIEILDQKSQRLKTLTDDLFEAAKASSGNIPVNLEQINIVSLITQGLGELNDQIEASSLEFKVKYPKESVYIKADGKLLWRAIENVLSNIFKYALRGSRVYVNIEDLGVEILLTIKNISAYELNISADELMERFKRGDESRSTKGSGLGLSIVKSLIEIQRGRFNIKVDGDLFKVMIYMPKYNHIST